MTAQHDGETIRVFVYVLRRDGPEDKLLVFDSHDEPGLEVPKGAVEQGESLEDAARREVEEESGIVGLHRLQRLETRMWKNERQHFFVGWIEESPAERFDHCVTGHGGDAGLVYRFQWLAVDRLIRQQLVQGSNSFLGELRRITCDGS